MTRGIVTTIIVKDVHFPINAITQGIYKHHGTSPGKRGATTFTSSHAATISKEAENEIGFWDGAAELVLRLCRTCLVQPL